MPRAGAPAATRRAPLAALAATALLAACGGGGGEVAGPQDAQAGAPVAEPSATVQGRDFVLWTDATALKVQAEQLVLEPAAGSNEVRLVVRLNPAAVPPSGRVMRAGAGGNGEAGDPAALRAQELSAKVAAVAGATSEVMSQSVLRLAPGAAVRQQFAHALEGFVLSVPWGQAQRVADELARNPAVDSVEVDRVVSAGQAAPAARTLDPRAWGVDRIDQRARAFDNSFRSAFSGSGVSVYVVDTGVSPHNQFGTRLRAGFSAVNDGRGTRDCRGHGTHVAGTAAGATLGVAPGALVVPVRVMDCNGSGATSQVIAGLEWVMAQGARPGVVNMSLGGPASSALDTAVQRLLGAGFTVVAAAGNSNVDACTQSPARAAGALAVAASDNADAKAGFSNWGSCVALWAPGTGITSAGIASADSVATLSGTSMAAPHAAGAAALVLQSQPAATAAQVRQRLVQQATANLVMGANPSMTRSLLYAGAEAAIGAAPGAPVPPVPAPMAVRGQGITMQAQVPALGAWAASATVQVVNDRAQPVANARVAGRFSNMANEVACTTAADGTCRVASAAAPWSAVPAIGFALTGITGTGTTVLAYSGAGVRSAQVSRPAAPVAGLSAITGTMQRATPGATAWTPRFTVTLLDERRNPVPSAVVQGVLTIHNGARAVGLQTVACQTTANGQCVLGWTGPALGTAHTGAVLQVASVTRPFLTYQPGALTRASVGRVQ